MNNARVYSFVVFSLLLTGFDVHASLNESNNKFPFVYMESQEEAFAQAERVSKFDVYFGPEHKELNDQQSADFNDQDYPNLKKCQKVWRDFSYEQKCLANLVAHVCNDSFDESLIGVKKDTHDSTQLSILVANLSLSPISELSSAASCGVTTFDSSVKSYNSDDEDDFDQVACKLLSPEQLKKQKLKAKKARNQANKSAKNLQKRLELDAENTLLENACKQAEQERLLQVQKNKKTIIARQYGLHRVGLDKNILKSKEGKMVVDIPCDNVVLRGLIIKLLDCVLADLRGDDRNICYDYDILPEITYCALSTYIEDGIELKPDILLRVASLSQELLMCAEKIDGSSSDYRKYLKYTSEQIAKITELVVKTI